MPVMRKDTGPVTGTLLQPFLPVERPAESMVDGGGNGDLLESRHMLTCAGH